LPNLGSTRVIIDHNITSTYIMVRETKSERQADPSRNASSVVWVKLKLRPKYGPANRAKIVFTAADHPRDNTKWNDDKNWTLQVLLHPLVNIWVLKL